MEQVVLASTKFTTDQLSTDELVALYMVATAGTDPTGVNGYEKGKALFTEHGGKRVHSMTLTALDLIVKERLGQ